LRCFALNPQNRAAQRHPPPEPAPFFHPPISDPELAAIGLSDPPAGPLRISIESDPPPPLSLTIVSEPPPTPSAPLSIESDPPAAGSFELSPPA